MMFDTILTSTIVTSALAAVFALLGKIWVNRVQERDRERAESDLKKLSHRIELSLHTNKSIFEKEFASAVASWNSVLKLVTEVQFLLRDARSGVVPNDQIRKCYEQHLETHDVLYMHAPFYPEIIRDAAFDTVGAAQVMYQEAENVKDETGAENLIESMCEQQFNVVQRKVEEFESRIRERYVSENALAQVTVPP
ncbi:MAG: hypothetical protein R3F50_08085 [Gammaproteobacteria bacterium]